MTTPLLSTRFQEALVFAAAIHNDQVRKSTTIPYVSHLMAVSALALEHGADEDVAIGALLHDAVEDEKATAAIIGERFGDRVRAIVEGCSDSQEHPRPPWRERKEAYIAHLKEAGPDTCLVSACDKVHNATAILRDYDAIGIAVWKRFNATPADSAWYYRSVADALEGRVPPGLWRQLDALADRIGAVTAESERAPA